MAWTEHLVWATSARGAALDAEAPLARMAEIFLRNLPRLDEVPFAKMTALHTLHLSNPAKNLRTLGGIQRAKKLRSLDCYTSVLTEIVPLGALCRLEWLSISGNKIGDLSPLVTCKRLKTLYVTKNPIRSVEPLARLRTLERIELAATLVKDILPLVALPKLQKLRLPRRLAKANLAAFRAARPDVEISF